MGVKDICTPGKYHNCRVPFNATDVGGKLVMPVGSTWRRGEPPRRAAANGPLCSMYGRAAVEAASTQGDRSCDAVTFVLSQHHFGSICLEHGCGKPFPHPALRMALAPTGVHAPRASQSVGVGRLLSPYHWCQPWLAARRVCRPGAACAVGLEGHGGELRASVHGVGRLHQLPRVSPPATMRVGHGRGDQRSSTTSLASPIKPPPSPPV